MILVERFVFNPFGENTYVLWDDNSKEGIVIDPGCADCVEEKRLFSFIEKSQINIKALINTHCHIDHILGNACLIDKLHVTFYAPGKDVFLLDMAVEQAQAFGIKIKPSPKPDKFISEDLELLLGENKISFLFTPGHTPGEFCVYIQSSNICVTGDVLFKESIGRTDLWGGDYDALINSIKTKLMTLPDETIIYPGHGDESTLKHEKLNNPFINQFYL